MCRTYDFVRWTRTAPSVAAKNIAGPDGMGDIVHFKPAAMVGF